MLCLCEVGHIMDWKKQKPDEDEVLTDIACEDCTKEDLSNINGYYHCEECEISLCVNCTIKRVGKIYKYYMLKIEPYI